MERTPLQLTSPGCFLDTTSVDRPSGRTPTEWSTRKQHVAATWPGNTLVRWPDCRSSQLPYRALKVQQLWKLRLAQELVCQESRWSCCASSQLNLFDGEHGEAAASLPCSQFNASTMPVQCPSFLCLQQASMSSDTNLAKNECQYCMVAILFLVPFLGPSPIIDLWIPFETDPDGKIWPISATVMLCPVKMCVSVTRGLTVSKLR